MTTTRKRRRFRFSLNGLAIQLSAFALSFTLVALLVVGGSQAAFVEESEVLQNYVPIGTAAPPEDVRPAPRPAAPSAPAGVTEPPPEPEPAPEPEVVEVELTDSQAGTALFGNDTLQPGAPVERCIAVAYAGTGDVEPVRLYASSLSGDLAPYLDLVVTMGDPAGGGSGSCSGFASSQTIFTGTLAAFAATSGDFATGLATWEPASGEETRGFRFSLSLRDDPAAAGRTATFGFSWRTGAT